MANLLRVRTLLTGNAVQGGGVNTLYFVQGTNEGQDVRGLVDLFWDAIMVRTNTGVTWTGDAVVDVVDEATGLIVGQDPVTPLTANGDVSGDVSPPATQGLIRMPTGTYTAGRQIRGRVFCPGVPEEHVTGGAPSSAYVATLELAATTLVADSFTIGSPLVVYSRTHNTSALVQSPSVWNKFAVLRSRRD